MNFEPRSAINFYVWCKAVSSSHASKNCKFSGCSLENGDGSRVPFRETVPPRWP